MLMVFIAAFVVLDTGTVDDARDPSAEPSAAPRWRRRHPPYTPLVKAFRRGLIVAIVAVVIGGVVKLRGKGGAPPMTGGWRELQAPDFR